MAEKLLYSRLQQKHDIEANWLAASDFIPLAGEIIIYDKDEYYDCERFKIGDGATKVNELPFMAPQADWNQNDEAAPDYVKNRTHYDAKCVAHFDYSKISEYEKLSEFLNSTGNAPNGSAASRIVGYYRISDLTPPIETLWNTGRHQSLLWESEKNMVVEETLLDMNQDGQMFEIDWNTDSFASISRPQAREPFAFLFVVYKENTVLRFGPEGHNFSQYTAVASKPGIYISVTNTSTGMQAFYGHLEWGELITLDEKYIPSTIARVSDIPEAVTVDPTLTIEGAAADAKAVGDLWRAVADDNDVIWLLAQLGLIQKLADETGTILTDEVGNILLL